MRKKVTLALLVLVCALTCVWGVACADKGGETHTHSYQWVDNGDGTHKQHCSVDDCDAPDIDTEPHVWGTDDKCEKCPAVKPNDGDNPPPVHAHSWSQSWQNDETHHWHDCTAAGCDVTDNALKDGYGAHDFTNGNCICGKSAPTAHAHNWSPDWQNDETHHWHDCTADGCDITDNTQKDGYAAHDFSDGNCICGKPAPHTHSWSPDWQNDETHHWHDCTADGCDITDNTQKDGYAAHDFSNGNCICGKPAPHTHSWSPDWQSNDSHHWHDCTTDGCDVTDNALKDGYGAHDFSNGNCICGMEKMTEGLAFTLNKDNGSYSVSGLGTTTDTDIYIGSTHQGKPVTAIAASAFKNSAIAHIAIGRGIASIDVSAFYGSSLERITVDENSANYASHDGVLFNKSKTRILYVPRGIRGSVTIPDGVTTIENETFANCRSLIDLTVPDSVTKIGKVILSGCASLESLTIPFVGSTPTQIVSAEDTNSTNKLAYLFSYYDSGNGAFMNDNVPVSLTKVTVTKYGPLFKAFYNCSYIEEIVLPDTTEQICESAFFGCKSLTSITLPEGVKTIGKQAFHDCKLLTSITLPSTVTLVRENAFYGCNAITLYCRKRISDLRTNWDRIAIDGAKTVSAPVVWNCDTSETTYDGFIYTIIDGVRYMLKNGIATVVAQPGNLTAATIPLTVTYKGIEYTVNTIEANAFKDCTALTIYCEAASQPEKWVANWNYGFPVVWDCKNNDKDVNGYAYAVIDGVRYSLKDNIASVSVQQRSYAKVTIPATVTYKGKTYAVTNIAYNAFSTYYNLTHITVPDSVTEIGASAFKNCRFLTRITYSGTKEQWNAITKGSSWNTNTGDFYVTCTDGSVDKNGYAL